MPEAPDARNAVGDITQAGLFGGRARCGGGHIMVEMQLKGRSSIPAAARERITARYVATRTKYMAECRFDGQLVGMRHFDESGELACEVPLRHGKIHGLVRWFEGGRPSFTEPYARGLPHGVARQWSAEGAPMGSYSMKRGTGIDVWRCHDSSGRQPYVSEIRHLKNGRLDGFEWWLDVDRRVWWERHFRNHQLHGIERIWNSRGRLRRGYPRYWMGGKQVGKRQYLRACAADRSLPPFRDPDNQATRINP